MYTLPYAPKAVSFMETSQIECLRTKQNAPGEDRTNNLLLSKPNKSVKGTWQPIYNALYTAF